MQDVREAGEDGGGREREERRLKLSWSIVSLERKLGAAEDGLELGLLARVPLHLTILKLLEATCGGTDGSRRRPS